MTSSNLLSIITFVYGLSAFTYLFAWIFKKPDVARLGNLQDFEQLGMERRIATADFFEQRQQQTQRREQQYKTQAVEHEAGLSGKIEEAGPGKNVLIRNKYIREDTGTHETLKILDESMIDSGEESGIDPYNTGGFDRSKNWNKRFSK